MSHTEIHYWNMLLFSAELPYHVGLGLVLEVRVLTGEHLVAVHGVLQGLTQLQVRRLHLAHRRDQLRDLKHWQEIN